MAESATTINENGVRWQYAMPRCVCQRSSTLLALRARGWVWPGTRFGTTDC